ncbi:MAG: hypothetical protein WKF37_17295, partial [Bryobacteraceae bacterium]
LRRPVTVGIATQGVVSAVPATPAPSAMPSQVAVAVSPKRRAKRVVRRREASPPEQQTAQRTNNFIPLPYTPVMTQYDQGQVVRVNVPRYTVRSWGIPVNESRMLERVQADVLLGGDGIAADRLLITQDNKMKGGETVISRNSVIRIVSAGVALIAFSAAAGQEKINASADRDVLVAAPGAEHNVMFTRKLESGEGPQAVFEFVSSEMGIAGKVVKNAPYTAEAVTETTQVLADGNRITHKSTASLARDGEGRTRRETTLGNILAMAGIGGLVVPTPANITIRLPV